MNEEKKRLPIPAAWEEQLERPGYIPSEGVLFTITQSQLVPSARHVEHLRERVQDAGSEMGADQIYNGDPQLPEDYRLWLALANAEGDIAEEQGLPKSEVWWVYRKGPHPFELDMLMPLLIQESYVKNTRVARSAWRAVRDGKKQANFAQAYLAYHFGGNIWTHKAEDLQECPNPRVLQAWLLEAIDKKNKEGFRALAMGLHDRVGRDSSVHRAMRKQWMSEPKTLAYVRDFAYGDE